MTEAVCTGDSGPADIGSLEIKRIDQPKIAADAESVTWIGIAAGGLSGIFTTDLTGAPYTSTTRVASGNEIPGTGGGVVSNIISGGVSSTGDLFFTAKLSLPSGTVRPSYKDGVLAACAAGDDCFTNNGLFEKGKQEGDLLKGGTVCEFVDDVSVSDFGVAFKATTDSENDPPEELGADICLQSAGPNSSIVEGVFRADGIFAGFDKIAEAGGESMPSPSPAGTQYASFRSSPVMNNDGDLCFIASTQGVIRLTYVYCASDFNCPGALPVNVLADRSTSAQGDQIRVFKDFDVSDPGYLAVQTTKGVFGGPGAFSCGPISPVSTLAARKDSIDGYDIKTFKPGVALGADATGAGDAVAFQGLAIGDGTPKNRNVVFTADLP
jgi:hypothetical protein